VISVMVIFARMVITKVMVVLLKVLMEVVAL
jgi:hypothetical protein